MGSINKPSPEIQYSKWSGWFGSCSSVIKAGECSGKSQAVPSLVSLLYKGNMLCGY